MLKCLMLLVVTLLWKKKFKKKNSIHLCFCTSESFWNNYSSNWMRYYTFLPINFIGSWFVVTFHHLIEWYIVINWTSAVPKSVLQQHWDASHIIMYCCIVVFTDMKPHILVLLSLWGFISDTQILTLIWNIWVEIQTAILKQSFDPQLAI